MWPAFLLALQLTSIATYADDKDRFSYTNNTFIKWDDCMAVYPGASLALGEKVTVFSDKETPIVKEIVHSISAKEAGRKYDEAGIGKDFSSPLWKNETLMTEVGCFHKFRGENPEVLVRITPGTDNYSGLGFGIRGLPAGTLIAGGKGVLINQQAASPYIKQVRHLVTDACYGADSLVRARQFPAQRGHTIIQLDIGLAELDTAKKGSYRSVEICRLFLHEEIVLGAERISRRSDQEERVDTAPPDLNKDNWADTTATAIGFISLNGGRNWDVLTIDGGFEGINYSIQRLDGSVSYFSMYLYTHH
jgi:hypothetical protein